MIRYTADFETTTDPETAHVWSWESCVVGDPDNFCRGIDIESFIEYCSLEDRVIYFHNLKFDSSYILSYLLTHGYNWSNKRALNKHEFSTLISNMGQFYSVTVCFGDTTTTFYDSLKLIRLSVEQIAKAYGLTFRKLEIDYDTPRPEGYIPTDEEWEYQHADVAIMSQALHILFTEGLTKITQGSNALWDYKEIVGKKNFKRWFPVLPPEIDAFCRKSYKGGATQVHKIFANQEIGCGITLDVNSMYPWAMYEMFLPFGEPIYYTGRYRQDKLYPLYIQKLACNFELKEGYIPTIQLKGSGLFRGTDFLESSDGNIVELTLTSVDLELFLDHYNVYNVSWISGYKFMQSKNMFTEYIDKWYAIKAQATKDGNKGLRQIAKDMMNSLSGKFGLRPEVQEKIPYYDEKLRFKVGEVEQRDSIYVPVVSFITSYGRDKALRSAQKNYDRFIYMDTDSLHLVGTELPDNLDIDSTKLGWWDLEKTWVRGYFIRAKTYIEEESVSRETMESMIQEEKAEPWQFYDVDGDLRILNITCAGMPKNCYRHVTYENFRPTNWFDGKLMPVMSKNGITLVKKVFTIQP
ncbi:DNA polymerase [Clostridium phage CI461P1]|uniref:DNA polymerase n=1 Tax=Clostridium phage CI461P1 TaxID=2968680 RepID=UPI0024341CAA|nr:DNA polymerase [Clostridium phage CI461P1]WAX11802.1 DNA polymerase [Clostridium phage CI461P1]WAX11822.1 DNA polymerase [Clostridium phage CI461P2]WAX11842.1 DNA polymerase [Clostridium phage CI461P3]